MLTLTTSTAGARSLRDEVAWLEEQVVYYRREITSDSSEDMVEVLRKLASYVLDKHFPTISEQEREDLILIGMSKGVKLLRGGHYDPTRSRLIHYLYTGMRNDIGHAVLRSRRMSLREVSVEDVSDAPSSAPVLEGSWLRASTVWQITGQIGLSASAAMGAQAYLTAMGLTLGMSKQDAQVLLDPANVVSQRIASLVVWDRMAQGA